MNGWVTNRWVTGVGKRDRFTSHESNIKRDSRNERKPFVPLMSADIQTGRVEWRRDLWQQERGVGA